MSMLDDLIIRDVFSARPAAGTYGRLFFASDTGAAYRDNGTTWDAITIASIPAPPDEVGPFTSSEGNWTQAHGRGYSPSRLLISKTSLGDVVFQAALRWDATNAYLTGTAAGITFFLESWR
jgi:hypothetical protein